MTIGQEWEKLTDLTLFHNHESIDFVTKFLPMSMAARDLIDKIRFDSFETFAKLGRGMILPFLLIFRHRRRLLIWKKSKRYFSSMVKQFSSLS